GGGDSLKGKCRSGGGNDRRQRDWERRAARGEPKTVQWSARPRRRPPQTAGPVGEASASPSSAPATAPPPTPPSPASAGPTPPPRRAHRRRRRAGRRAGRRLVLLPPGQRTWIPSQAPTQLIRTGGPWAGRAAATSTRPTACCATTSAATSCSTPAGL